MGEIDVENLHKIYRACTDFSMLTGLKFQFLVDTGHKETAIRFWEDGRYEKPVSYDTALVCNGINRIFVPDIIDFNNKIIVEFEETPGPPRPGARLAKKGHDPDGQDKRTSIRDIYYKIGKFRLLKIFDYEFHNEIVWKMKLFRFLMDCQENKLELLI